MSDAPPRAPQRKPTPIRTCVVCRRQASKRDLMRIVMTETGLVPDPAGKRIGRGAYLCNSPACWSRAASSDVLAKALKTALSPEDRLTLTQFKAGS